SVSFTSRGDELLRHFDAKSVQELRWGNTDANKQIFDRLHSYKEQIETLFGGELSWQRLDAKQSCRIAHTVSTGGWRSDEAKWPEIQDAMIDEMMRLERALKPLIATLKSDFS
ncbi:MAG: DUF4268 domain-containing protein, partial [Isosphaeraceae bacterium]